MVTATPRTFIVDCPFCKARVAATEKGRAEYSRYDEDYDSYPFNHQVLTGNCPICTSILVGETEQIGFEGFNSNEDRWSDVVRVYPKPPKTFSSNRIPRVVKDSLNEADRSLQVGANIAACVMFGRALEALCRDVIDSGSGIALKTTATTTPSTPNKKIMLGEGIKKIRDMKVIDDRL